MKEFLIVGDEIRKEEWSNIKEARERYPRALAVIPVVKTPKKLSPASLCNIFEDMATMLSSGMGLGDSLSSVVASAEEPGIANFFYLVMLDVLSGKKFSAAMNRPEVPKLVLSVIRAGEESGQLGEVLRVIAAYYQTVGNVNSKIGMAMIMPQATILLTAIVFVYMLKSLFPQLKVYATSSGSATFTGIPGFFFMLSNHVIPVSIVLLIAVVAFFKYKNLVIQKMPIIGPVYTKLEFHLDIFLFASIMSLSLAAGVQMQEAVSFVVNDIRAKKLKGVIKHMQAALDRGTSLTESLSTADAPPMLRNVVNVGERTGKLPETFGRLATNMKNSVLNDVAIVENTMPIAMTLILGVVVFALVGSFYYIYFTIIAKSMGGI